MIIHPEIGALRGDDSPQRTAQQAAHDAMVAWHALPQVDRLRREIEVFASDGEFVADGELSRLFEAGKDAANRLADSLVRSGVDLLVRAPLAHLPQRHSTDGTVSMLLLARSGNVTLTLVAIDGAALAAGAAPATVNLWPGEAWEHVLAGTGRAELVDVVPDGPERARLDRQPIALRPGTVLHRDASRLGFVLHGVDGCLVSLRLQRRRPLAGMVREYALSDGRLAHTAAGNPRDSRVEVMMALLGRMKRADAAPLMADLAQREGPDSLRWQALRECLALDSLTGFQALCAVARDAGDPLFVPAGALRSQLIETDPQLARLETCPG